MTKVNIMLLSLALSIPGAAIIYSIFPKENSDTKISTTLNNSQKEQKEIVKNCPAANDFYKTIEIEGKKAELNIKKDNREISQEQGNEIYHNMMVSISKSTLLAHLEDQSHINNECGATSLNFLDAIYSELGEANKANYFNQKLVKFAENNNPTAMQSLCYRSSRQPEMLKFCSEIMHDDSARFSEDTKKSAVLQLTSFYYLKDDAASLSKICNITKDAYCYNNLNSLAENLLNKKEFSLANAYFTQLITYAESLIDLPKHDSYQENTIRSLSRLYRNTNQTNKLISFCANINLNEKYKSDCDIDLVFLGDEFYENQKNYKQAFDLYMAETQLDEKSKNGFDEFAVEKIAQMYAEGKGTEKSFSKALRWYRKNLTLTKSRSTKANIYGSIGIIFIKQKNSVGAYNAFKNSAKLGNSWYQVNLAIMYYNGDGVIQDYAEAYAWVSVALAIGVDDKEHKKIAEIIKNRSRSSLIYNTQPGSTLRDAIALAKQYYDEVVNQATSN